MASYAKILLLVLCTLIFAGCGAKTLSLDSQTFIEKFNGVATQDDLPVHVKFKAQGDTEYFKLNEYAYMVLVNEDKKISEVLIIVRPDVAVGFGSERIATAEKIFSAAIKATGLSAGDASAIISELNLQEIIREDLGFFSARKAKLGELNYWALQLPDKSALLIMTAKNDDLGANYSGGKGVLEPIIKRPLPMTGYFSTGSEEWSMTFNETCDRESKPQFKVNSWRNVVGDVQDAAQFNYNERLLMMTTLGKSGLLREVSIIIFPSGDLNLDEENFLKAKEIFALAELALDENLTRTEAEEIQRALNLNVDFRALQDNSADHNGQKYNVVRLPNIGVALTINQQ